MSSSIDSVSKKNHSHSSYHKDPQDTQGPQSSHDLEFCINETPDFVKHNGKQTADAPSRRLHFYHALFCLLEDNYKEAKTTKWAIAEEGPIEFRECLVP